jgi:hypothetical protein
MVTTAKPQPQAKVQGAVIISVLPTFIKTTGFAMKKETWICFER